MRLTFRRTADRRPVETLVERDDGVAFAMRGAGGGRDLPHARGRPVAPAQARTLGLGPARRGAGRCGEPPRLGREVLPGEITALGMPRPALVAAAAELRDVGCRWAGLNMGDVWVVEWPATPARRRKDRPSARSAHS